MRRIATIALFFGLFTCFTLADYTLQNCYQLAISRSEVLADQQEQVQQAEEHYKQAVGALLPTLTGMASYTIQPNSSDQLLFKANATAPLFRGFRMVGAIKQNESLLSAQKEAKQLASLQLYADVAQAVYLYAYLQQDKQLLLEEQSLYKKRLKELQDRVNIGRSRKTEVFSMDISLIQLQTLLIQSQSQIAAAENFLQFLTGIAPPLQITLESSNLRELLPLSHYLGHVEKRPDLKASTHRLQSAKAAEQITGESTPLVDFNSNLYLMRPAPNQNNVWDAQILMTLPNFLGDVSASKTREASSIRKQAEITLGLLLRKAQDDISTLYASLIAEKKQILLLEDALSISAKNLDSVVQDYRLGLSNNLDVLQAMNAYIDMKRSLNKIRFAYKTDIARLDSLTATLPIGVAP